MRARLRERGSRWALWAAAVVAIPLAIVLALGAIDVLRLSGNVERDDRQFQTAPLRQKGLWDASALPSDMGAQLAGLEDDVEYRRLVALYRRVEPGRVNFEGFPELEKLRAKLQFELTRASGEEPDPGRRSRLLTLYGVMTLDKRTLNDEDRDKILQAAVEAFRAAIELDPENEDAKTNLETLLRVFGPVALVGPNPSSGQSKGNVSGQGSVGGGY